jgi:hypothetical protein
LLLYRKALQDPSLKRIQYKDMKVGVNLQLSSPSYIMTKREDLLHKQEYASLNGNFLKIFPREYESVNCVFPHFFLLSCMHILIFTYTCMCVCISVPDIGLFKGKITVFQSIDSKGYN